MDFRILGPLEVVGESGPVALGGGKQRALLADLILSPGRTVAMPRLIDDLWGEDIPTTASKMVQVYVSRLRKVLPDGVLRTRPPGYVLDISPDDVDLVRFERLTAAGRGALAAGDPSGAATALREALALWRGPALMEFDEPFAEGEARRLEEHQLAALEDRIEAELALASPPDLVAEIEALVHRHPLRERLRGYLMIALYRRGRQAEALTAYHEARRALAEELGLEPSQALRDLERRILRQDPELDPAPRVGQRTGPAGGVPRAEWSPPKTAVTAMVGREGELARLREHLDRARTGERQLVFVVGEPGIGKTTLVDAALTESGTDPSGPRVGRGQCIEQHGAGEAYLPVLEALDHLASGGGDPAVVRTLAHRAPTWLVQMPWLVADGDLALLQQRVLGATRDRMLREAREALRAIANDRPLLLVLEDLHWSDPSTIDLLGALARRVDAGRIMMLGTFRPAEAGGRDHAVYALAGELAARGLADVIELNPLDEGGIRDYLAGRAPGAELPDEVYDVLRHRSRGNPLYLEKTVDAWIDDGKIQEVGGSFRLLADPADLAREVPGTLLGLIRSRLDVLSAEDRSLMEAAAVAGPEFSAALVATVCGRDAVEVEARCDALGRGRLIIERRGEERWPDGTISGRFGFTHDLYQEALYDALPPGRRALLHGGIADRIERAFAPHAADLAAELGAHFVRAGDAARAVPHLIAAARRSLERVAPVEAIDLINGGLSMLGQIADHGVRDRFSCALHQLLGPALIAVEGWSSAAAERALVTARSLADGAGEDDVLTTTTFMLATMYEARGEYDRSDRLLEGLLARPGGSLQTGSLVDPHEVLACSLFHQGDFERSLTVAEQGLALYDGEYANPLTASYGDDAGVSCHLWAALCLWFLGRPEQADARAREAVTLASDPRRRHGLATALAQAAVVAQCRLDAEAAGERARAAREVATGSGFRYRIAMSTILEGWALAAQGSPDDGIERIEDGLELARPTGVHMDDAYFLGLLGDAYARAGRVEEAIETIDRALEVVPRGGRFFFGAELHRLRGELLFRSERHAEGEAAVRRGLDVARAQGTRSLELRAAVTLGELLRASSAADVEALVAPVLATFTEGFDEADLRRARELIESPGR